MTADISAQARQKLTAARAALILDHGFFGMLALRLQLVEKNDIPTLAVDGRHVFYNAEFVLSLSHDFTISAMAHEVLHCVFEHMIRRGTRTPKRWNFACDYAINLILEESKFEIGPGWLLDKQYAGMTADQIYNLLPDTPEDKSGGKSPLDEIMDGTDADGNIDEALAAEWQVATIQAATQAAKQGKLAGGLERFVEEITNPTVDWRAQLQRWMTTVSKDDYSWMRPNRRFLQAGFYMPGLYSESLGPITVAIDTSGSITPQLIAEFGAEIQTIADMTNPSEIRVIYCDDEISHIDVFARGEPLHFKPHGGGGTDFRPPFEYLEREGITPEVFVYLTDLEGPFPAPVDYPTLWCSTTRHIAPFGHTIHIKD